ncbi:hypothetical protein AT268_32005 [Bacillus cereus]|uniref:Uncharacterized protein n=1 Tax=Bacillus cereus TaxID=1396 RepID=A0A9X0MJU1_BACCE|nr:hypothetical protein [Bacillus cereus]KXY51127.1 hypothetical protein AT268_32005 [Bacillus cereus]
MWIVLRLFIVCIVLFLIKKSNLSFYQKYQGAFDSQPGDFTMVKMAFETVDNVWYSINKKDFKSIPYEGVFAQIPETGDLA